MGYASKKGYEAEHAVLGMLRAQVPAAYRPRTTSASATDVGDVAGLPMVVSVKNHRELALAHYIDEVSTMVARSPHETGVVIVKRAGKGLPEDWYVVTSGRLFMPLLAAYLAATP